jgi:ABC-type Na+ efflux pump permease subunit
MFVIAAREYNAAVRTKAFVITLLIMPIMMGGSIAMQALLRDKPVHQEKHFAVIDRTGGGEVLPKILEGVAKHNKENPQEIWEVEDVVPPDGSRATLGRLREELSGKVRDGKLLGFAEIGPEVFAHLPQGTGNAPQGAAKGAGDDGAVIYRTNRPLEDVFPHFVEQLLTEQLRNRRMKEFALDQAKVKELVRQVPVVHAGLARRGSASGGEAAAADETPQQSALAAFLAPFGLLFLMFMVVLLTSTPLMQGVVEEKMQRIAEVLLGSVRPFELMLGKLLGMTAVSLTISAVYLGGGLWITHHFGYAEYLSAGLLAWFLVYQALAALMYGSLFTAVGAACTDMKETQTMLWPVMLLVMIPMFLVGNVIREPNGPMVTGMSLFPFATPMLMVARMAVPPGVPLWQPIVGVAGVLVTTLLCVWAAGRIFRIGILLQGKGANLGQIVRWVFRG